MTFFKLPLQVVFLYLLVFLLFSACGSQDGVSPHADAPELRPCGIDQTDNVSTLTATLNDNATYCPTVIGGGPALIICMVNQLNYEVKVDSMLTIHILTPEPKAGTYTVEDGMLLARFNKYVLLNKSHEIYYLAMEDHEFESSGTLTIEELTDEYVKGTFEFVLAAFDEATDEPTGGAPLLITDGRFNIAIDNK